MYTLKLLDTSIENSKRCELLKKEVHFWEHLNVEEMRSPSFFDVYKMLNPKTMLFFSVFKTGKLIGLCSLIELNHIIPDLYYVSDLMVHESEKGSFVPSKIIKAIENYLMVNNKNFIIIGLENRYFAFEALEKIFAKKKMNMGFSHVSHLYVLEASKNNIVDTNVIIDEIDFEFSPAEGGSIPFIDKKHFEYLKSIDKNLIRVRISKNEDFMEAILFSDDLLRTFEYQGQTITKNNLLITKKSTNLDLNKSAMSYFLNKTSRQNKKYLYCRSNTENAILKNESAYHYVNRQFHISKNRKVPEISLGITV